ncbi:ABC transporter ATP-binding protein [Pseudorhodoferax sp. Leaf274]|uniref:ABC transporter ATP-binding protein n=1 Tax=Pseudorhodoferax sp. Leaf274 TaxID=1736318 RepID=UPI000702A0F4|nr:ABC transporter ATP-binding protein [Pseudorhodoferax sp. Leaf274]KQP37085.1 ABC transporter ATP-binding protein [Pseudorhodoferax sp. Leaf274]
MTAPLLEIRNLQAWYGGVQVLFGYDLTVAQGSITALLGANGAGKTTTLRAICNVMVRRQGEIRFGGRSLQGLPAQDVVRLGISHVPDGRGTFAQLSVVENLQLGGYTLPSRDDVAQGIEEVYAMFPRLKERHGQQAGTLSGGEQQMLAIGRALMPRPKLLLLDEPSFGLAPLIVRGIFDTVQRIVAERQVSVLIVEQNAHLALEIAHEACLIDVGRAVLSGSADDLRRDSTVRQVYLGY